MRALQVVIKVITLMMNTKQTWGLCILMAPSRSSPSITPTLQHLCDFSNSIFHQNNKKGLISVTLQSSDTCNLVTSGNDTAVPWECKICKYIHSDNDYCNEAVEHKNGWLQAFGKLVTVDVKQMETPAIHPLDQVTDPDQA